MNLQHQNSGTGFKSNALFNFYFIGAKSLELMIRQNQAARANKMESLIDDLAAKYGGQSKGRKRKAAPTSTKSKRKK